MKSKITYKDKIIKYKLDETGNYFEIYSIDDSTDSKKKLMAETDKHSVDSFVIGNSITFNDFTIDYKIIDKIFHTYSKEWEYVLDVDGVNFSDKLKLYTHEIYSDLKNKVARANDINKKMKAISYSTFLNDVGEVSYDQKWNIDYGYLIDNYEFEDSCLDVIRLHVVISGLNENGKIRYNKRINYSTMSNILNDMYGEENWTKNKSGDIYELVSK